MELLMMGQMQLLAKCCPNGCTRRAKMDNQSDCFAKDFDEEGNIEWVNSFKEAFARATNSSVSYKILFSVYKTSIEPFESVNERTEEKLTLEKAAFSAGYWLLKRCPISEKAAAIQWENDENWDDNLNNVTFDFYWGDFNESIGPLSPPTEEENEEADESNEN